MLILLIWLQVLFASSAVAESTSGRPRAPALANSSTPVSIALTGTNVSTVTQTLQEANVATRTMYLTPEQTNVVATETMHAGQLGTVVRTQIVAASTIQTVINGTTTETLGAIITSSKVNTGVAEISIAATNTGTLAAIETKEETRTAVLGAVTTIANKTATGTLGSIQNAATVTLISPSTTGQPISTTRVPTTVFVTISGGNATSTITTHGETTITQQAPASTITSFPETKTITQPTTVISETTIVSNGSTSTTTLTTVKTVTTTNLAQGFTLHMPIPVPANRTITEISTAPTTVVVGTNGTVTKTVGGTTLLVTKPATITASVLVTKYATVDPATVTVNRSITCLTCSGGYTTVTKTVPKSPVFSFKPCSGSVVQTVQTIKGEVVTMNKTMPCGSTTKGTPVTQPKPMAMTTVTSVMTYTTRKCASCPVATATKVVPAILPVKAHPMQRRDQVAFDDSEGTTSISPPTVQETSLRRAYPSALFAASRREFATSGTECRRDVRSRDPWPLPMLPTPLPVSRLSNHAQAAKNQVQRAAMSPAAVAGSETVLAKSSAADPSPVPSCVKLPSDRDVGAHPGADLSDCEVADAGAAGSGSSADPLAASPMDTGDDGSLDSSSSATAGVTFSTGRWFVAMAVGAQVLFMML